MDTNRRRTMNWSAVGIGAALVALIVVVVWASGVLTPDAPLQVGGGLPACESAEVEEGVAQYIAAKEPGADIAIVSIQEFGREQGLGGGPVVRRDCQVTLRRGEGYDRVTLELAAEGGTDGAAWHLRLVETTEPPVAAPTDGVPLATPPQE
jgi:hypothetical protein